MHSTPYELPMELSVESMEKLIEEYNLTSRELHMIQLILRRNVSNSDIAKKVGLTNSTIRQYLHILYAKFRVNSKLEVILELADRGFLIPSK